MKPQTPNRRSVHVPFEVERIAVEVGWSQPTRAYYGVTPAMGCGYVLAALFGLALAGGIYHLVSLWFTTHARTFWNTAGQAAGGISMVALFFVVACGILLYYGGQRVYVCEQGLIYL